MHGGRGSRIRRRAGRRRRPDPLSMGRTAFDPGPLTRDGGGRGVGTGPGRVLSRSAPRARARGGPGGARSGATQELAVGSGARPAGRTPRPGTPTTSPPCWPSSPPTPWCASAGGGAARRVGHPRPAGGARLPGRRPPTARLRPQGLVWAIGHRQIAAWAAARLRAPPPLRGRPDRAPGDTVGWPYREFVDPFQRRAGLRPGRGRRRRRWCAAAGSRCSASSSRPRPCSGGERGGRVPPGRATRPARRPGRAGPSAGAGPPTPPPNRPARPGPWRWAASPSSPAGGGRHAPAESLGPLPTRARLRHI